jgi:ubiquinol-cytochrome c reductase subunit 6
VNPVPAIREACKAECPGEKKQYDACVKRITESKQGDCEAWFIDFVRCVDKCLAPKVFQATKGG